MQFQHQKQLLINARMKKHANIAIANYSVL